MTLADWVFVSIYAGLFLLITAVMVVMEYKKRAKRKRRARFKFHRGGKYDKDIKF